MNLAKMTLKYNHDHIYTKHDSRPKLLTTIFIMVLKNFFPKP